MSLLGVLATIAVTALLTGVMVTMYVTSLNFTQANTNGDQATREAEAGMDRVIAELVNDPLFHKDVSGSLSLESQSEKSVPLERRPSFYQVRFAGLTGPYSTNNFKGESSCSGFRCSVPAGAVHVISEGYCKGQWRTVEALVAHPHDPAPGPLRRAADLRAGLRHRAVHLHPLLGLVDARSGNFRLLS